MIVAERPSIADGPSGKSLSSAARIIVADQTTRVTAAVDAGRQAYKTANTEPETHEY